MSPFPLSPFPLAFSTPNECLWGLTLIATGLIVYGIAMARRSREAGG